jgi:rhomboid family GlyGly-CTERM serine protease
MKSTKIRSFCVSSQIGDWLGRILCLLVPVLAFIFMQSGDCSRLTEGSLSSGAWHTLWTGHFLHFTFDHFLWDALMFAALALLLWREERWKLWGWILLSAPLISVLLFMFDPQLTEYRGLSALDSLLYARVCWGFCFENKKWQRWVFGILPLVGFFGKTVYELSTGTTLFVSELGPGVVPLPLAHLLGFICGSFWALCSCGRSSYFHR